LPEQPLRVGLMMDANPSGRRDPGYDAVRAEHLTYDLLMVHPDHPSASGTRGSGPTDEMWTMLTWMAARTERILLSPAVLSLPYRPPPVVAKMAETLDRLSGHRLVLALGSGGDDEAFRAFGLPVLRPSAQVAALDEAIAIIRSLWSRDRTSRAGQYQHLDQARINPRPQGPIPIWVGGYGDRMLDLVGRTADGWLPTTNALSPSESAFSVQRIRRAAEGAGRDPDSLTFAYVVRVYVTNKRSGSAAVSPNTISGHPAFIVDELTKLIDKRFSTLVLWPDKDHEQQRELLAEHVVSPLRAR